MLLAGAVAAAALKRPDEIRRVALLVGSFQHDTAASRIVPAPAAAMDTGVASVDSVDVIPQGTPTAASVPATAAPSPSVSTIAAAQRATDSAAVVPVAVPHADSLQITPGDGAQLAPNVLRHPWLRANGDSGSTLRIGADAPPEDRLAGMADELRGHVQLGLRRIAAHDFAGARAAFRDANDEARILKFTFPEPRVTRRVDALMLNGMRDAFRACELARGDSTDTDSVSVDCGALFSRWARAG